MISTASCDEDIAHLDRLEIVREIYDTCHYVVHCAKGYMRRKLSDHRYYCDGYTWRPEKPQCTEILLYREMVTEYVDGKYFTKLKSPQQKHLIYH